MTDRELLELAAKASGELTPSWYGNDAYFEGVLSRWNPLTDDGDALRLAVHLFQDIKFWYFDNSISVGNNLRVPCGADPVADMRRAIVRAAAEIGRSMK